MYSVIIPSIGRLKYLNHLIKSIFSQTISPSEVILLLENNNHCKKITKKIFNYKKCKIHYCNNLNLSEMRNYGVSIARSKNILFSDDDDIWEKNKAEKINKSLKKYKVVTHDFTKFGAKLQKQKFLLGKSKKIIPLYSLIQGTNLYGGGSSISAKKEVLLSIPFNENLNYSEDFEWWARVILSDIKIEYLPEALVNYRTHATNMTSRSFKTFSFKLKIFTKLFYKSLILFSCSLIGITKSLISLAISFIKNILRK